MTIYFDKRALEQQKKEDEEIKQEELDKKAEQEKNIETGRQAVNAVGNLFPVSYTHLTLPTKA